MHIMNMPMTVKVSPSGFFAEFGSSAPKDKAIRVGTCQLYRVKMIYAMCKRASQKENARLERILNKIG